MQNHNLDRYFVTLDNHLKNIRNLKEDLDYTVLYQKTLLMNFIDLMSKCVYPKMDSNYKRFVSFVLEFCDWDDAERISLPTLHNEIHSIDSDELTSLKEYINNEINSWPRSRPIMLEKEPFAHDIKDLWPSTLFESKTVFKKKVTQSHFTHVSLLWRLRNSLVHELRTLGFGFKLFDESDEPHYIPWIDTNGGYNIISSRKNQNRIWDLFYPINFCFNLAWNGKESLKEYCVKNNVNPYDSHTFGPSWLRELDLK